MSVLDRSVVRPSRGATFYFGHSATVVPLITAVGLFRDSRPLTADLRPSDRQFRTSRIDPMSANVAFALYDCAACQGRVVGTSYLFP